MVQPRHCARFLEQWAQVISLEKALAAGGINARAEGAARRNLPIAKDHLAAQQAKAAAAAAAARAAATMQVAKDKLAAAEQAAMPFTCAASESVSDTPLDGCNGCQDSLERPFYYIKRCQKDHWQEHRKVCASKQGGGAARGE